MSRVVHLRQQTAPSKVTTLGKARAFVPSSQTGIENEPVYKSAVQTIRTACSQISQHRWDIGDAVCHLLYENKPPVGTSRRLYVREVMNALSRDTGLQPDTLRQYAMLSLQFPNGSIRKIKNLDYSHYRAVWKREDAERLLRHASRKKMSLREFQNYIQGKNTTGMGKPTNIQTSRAFSLPDIPTLLDARTDAEVAKRRTDPKQPFDFTLDMYRPLLVAVRRLYPGHYRKDVHERCLFHLPDKRALWTGPDTVGKEMARKPSEWFTEPVLRKEWTEKGAAPMDILLYVALQLGIEQGKRMAVNEGYA